jgi:signal peptidase I
MPNGPPSRMRHPGLKAVVLAAVVILVLALFSYGILNDTRRVSGTSMLPTLETGDLVVIEHVPASSIQVGDIIVYNPPCASEGFSVIHRVVNITSSGSFITKGDNNPGTDQAEGIADGPVNPSCVQGVVVFVVPYIERLASLPYGVNYALAILIVLIVVVSELRPREENAKKEPEIQQAI